MNRRTRSIDLEITSVCNAVCPFCPREVQARGARYMPLAVAARIASRIRDAGDVERVVLCGIGEPTLHRDLDEIVRILADTGVMVCLTTNGSRLSVSRVDALVRAGLTEINVSLNAARPETHRRVMNLSGFEAIRGTIRDIAARRATAYPGLELNVSFVACRDNEEEAAEFIEEWRARDVTRVWIHPANNRGGLLAEMPRAGDLAPLRRRFAGDSRVWVDIFDSSPERGRVCRIAERLEFVSVDGELLLCAMDYARRHAFGSVADHGLAALRERKIGAFLRGATMTTCAHCDFCPAPAAKRYAGSGTS
jgi:MoaA/NifB/PqqE/SkfB family radical SAM enzyme